MAYSEADRRILRDLARRAADIADHGEPASHQVLAQAQEMVLKDTHTCQHHPERFDRWTRLARETIEEVVGPPSGGSMPWA